MTKRDQALINLSRRLDTLGVSLSDQSALRRIELTLSRWNERECGDENGNAIERDEVTGKPYATYRGSFGGDGKRRRYAIADKERGALARLAAIMKRYPHLWAYHQGDPRGCSLYVGRYLDLPSGTNLSRPESVIDQYYTRGVAVCI